MNIFNYIAKAVSEKHISQLFMLETKSDLLLSDETRVINWIIDYTTKYSECPSLSRLSEQFSSFMLVAVPEEPLLDCYEQAITFANNRLLSNVLNKTHKDIERNKVNAYDLLLEEFLSKALSSRSSNVINHDDIFEDYMLRSMAKPFYIPTFDKYTFLAEGELVWFAGRPETFKTTICQWLAMKQYLNGENVLIVSNETSLKDYASKIDCFLTGIPLASFYSNSLTETELGYIKALKQNLSKMTGGRLSYIKGSVKDVLQIEAHIKNSIEPYSFVVIDGAYKMGNLDGWASIAKVSSDLKMLALNTGSVIMGPLHTSRNNDLHEEVSQTDIAGSDNWLRDCDKLWGGHLHSSLAKGIVTLKSLKSRPIAAKIPPINAFVNRKLNYVSFNDKDIKINDVQP